MINNKISELVDEKRVIADKLEEIRNTANLLLRRTYEIDGAIKILKDLQEDTGYKGDSNDTENNSLKGTDIN